MQCSEGITPSPWYVIFSSAEMGRSCVVTVAMENCDLFFGASALTHSCFLKTLLQESTTTTKKKRTNLPTKMRIKRKSPQVLTRK